MKSVILCWQFAILICGFLLPLAGPQRALSQRAAAQRGEGVPDRRYFSAVDDLYSGKVRNAERIFRRETKRGVRVGSVRWVDSICYHAMLGETYFQLGNNSKALAEFDQACQLFMHNPNWLLRVSFSTPPRPDNNRSRRTGPAWGRSQRQLTPGQLPGTMMVLHGRQQTLEEIKQKRVTVVETPRYFQVQVTEIVRCTALAIRRRNEILGPLGKYDPVSKELVAVLSQGGLSPPNHWSRAWIELPLGLAQLGVGNNQEAQSHLSRALLIDGRYDHALTCVVLLEQGRLAMQAGNSQLATQLLAEASYSAFWYENYNVVDEALRLGSQNHLIATVPGVYPPLDLAAGWARRKGLRLLAANFRVALAENQATLAQPAAASNALDEATRWLGEMAAGPAGTRHLYVQALLHYQQGKIPAGDDLLVQALGRQRAMSIRSFQVLLTNRLFDGDVRGRISAREASLLYEKMLGDPNDRDWAERPLDTLAQTTSFYEGAMDRWFAAMLERKDELAALEVAGRAKRRRFLTALPWGGRLLSLRGLLESTTGNQANDIALRRQQILTDFPAYQEIASEGLALQRELAAGPVLSDEQPEIGQLNDLYKRWSRLTQTGEAMLREIGLRRVPAPITFPPFSTTVELQAKIPEGQVVVVFHIAGGMLHGFLLTGDGYTHWQLGREGAGRKDIGNLLRKLGNYGPGRNLSAEDLQASDWRNDAHRLYQQIFGESRLEIGKTQQLVVVPDGLLWYLPFEMLVPDEDEDKTLLIDQALVRYAPTLSLAIDEGADFGRVRHTGIVAPNVSKEANEEYVEKAMENLTTVVSGPVRLSAPMPYSATLIKPLLDQLISFDDIQLSASQPFDWSPLPKGRGRGRSSLIDTMALPHGGPERVVLAGFSTAAENGLKETSRRKERRSLAPGREIFLSTCSLMASGARTVLLSRWRTSGQTNLSLVQEFVQELPSVSAAEAWQRSVLLAREAPLDPAREPRLKFSDKSLQAIDEPSTGNHPFFWAGYLLIDTGHDPAAKQDETETETEITETEITETEIDAAEKENMPAVEIEKPEE